MAEVTRFIRLANNKQDLEPQIKMFIENLIKRGYKRSEVERLIKEKLKTPRDITIKYNTEKNARQDITRPSNNYEWP